MDMTLERIPIVLKRFTFDEKMALCQMLSRKIMKLDKLEFISISNVAYPWEIEIICALSIMTKNEYGIRTFNDIKGQRTINAMIKCLREYRHPQLELDFNINHFLMVTGQQQFLSQRNVRLRLFRYNFLFNYKDLQINMPLEIQKIYGVNYSLILEAVWTMYFFIGLEGMSSTILNYVFNKYRDVLAHFAKSRDENIKLQLHFFPKSVDSYYYGFKAIYPYPLIIENNVVHFPVPYLLIDAATESVLSELTRDNDSLREKIGKHAVEGYLNYLLNLANCYEEVVQDFKYDISSKRKNLRTPDVMVRAGHRCIFFECKSAVPFLSLRDFDLDKIKATKERYANSIIQVFNRIQDFREGFYYPFKHVMDFSVENIFGVVVLLEDSFIPRGSIYEEVATKLNLSMDSPSMYYIRSNIKIIDFHEIEDVSFCGEDYSKCLEIQRNNPSDWNNYNYFNHDEKKVIISELQKFFDILSKIIEDLGQELKIRKLIQ